MDSPTKKTDPLSHEQRRARRPDTSLAFRRSSNKVIAGVASGISDFTSANPTVIRILLVIGCIASFSIVGFVYLALWLMVPQANSNT